ncbi:polysaccharide export outer membrane protein [Pseudooceanicola antarcticus]|uniref:Polysaccharide export outer membrane protein n=1 Tax=Pseudooceanicola antarcticus TaxID=1247613 RepID=A0A285JC96_9RHOB|nr:polysaccharide biosynthesis/export family protein [Pseudooceanicola antarcticus]PJE30788.1 sugar ABC transporter substrate-binding protein [Pseudooceanicola antarcticus]SNY57016.1 polysaccharide export outer membrane protein [Pseudooceanicola antarcticus]
MTFIPSRWARPVALIAALCAVSSCAVLPRSGPTKREIYAGSVQREGDAFVVAINDRVTRATAVIPALGFSEQFLRAGPVGSDVIRPGDTLSLTIWENVDEGLLASEGVNYTSLSAVQVDGAGFIFVPYAGRIRAAGNSPEAIRRIITEKLADQTPDPQVEVVREAGDGASVTLIGAIGGSGVYPIERPTLRLSGMLAAAGGISVAPESALITVVRGNQRSTIWFQDLFDDPRYDIALRNGDRILLEEDTRSFTVLGAAGTQSVIDFESQTLSGIEAIAQAGGLRANSADPTGVFVFRNEAEEIAEQVLGRSDLTGAQRMVYVLDLTQPNGMFMARDFLIRDGDLLYVTEAPFTQWDKTIAALTGSLGSVNSLTSLGE